VSMDEHASLLMMSVAVRIRVDPKLFRNRPTGRTAVSDIANLSSNLSFGFLYYARIFMGITCELE
jgi:hypothetical protein